MTHEIIIPFSGFYHSIHDTIFDQVVDLYNEDGKYSADDLMMFTDWYEVRVKYARKYTQALSHLTDIEFKFKSLISPKYYNYETDRIVGEIELGEIQTLKERVNPVTLAKLIKDNFTSRSGFISFYPNDLKRWDSDVTKWDCVQLGTLLEAFILDQTKAGEIKDNLEYQIIWDYDLNEVAQNAILEHFDSVAANDHKEF